VYNVKLKIVVNHLSLLINCQERKKLPKIFLILHIFFTYSLPKSGMYFNILQPKKKTLSKDTNERNISKMIKADTYRQEQSREYWEDQSQMQYEQMFLCKREDEEDEKLLDTTDVVVRLLFISIHNVKLLFINYINKIIVIIDK